MFEVNGLSPLCELTNGRVFQVLVENQYQGTNGYSRKCDMGVIVRFLSRTHPIQLHLNFNPSLVLSCRGLLALQPEVDARLHLDLANLESILRDAFFDLYLHSAYTEPLVSIGAFPAWFNRYSGEAHRSQDPVVLRPAQLLRLHSNPCAESAAGATARPACNADAARSVVRPRQRQAGNGRRKPPRGLDPEFQVQIDAPSAPCAPAPETLNT